jgi:peroxiredoxin
MNPVPSNPGSEAVSTAARDGIPRLAIASLVLGVLGLLTSVIVVGGLLALVGLILGIMHLRRRTDGRGLGWSGVSISALGLLLAVVLASFYISTARRFARMAGEGPGGAFRDWYGKPAPEVELATIDGGTVRLSELRGRRVILDFWATWCPPCVQKVPHYIRLQQELPEDVAIVAVSGEDRGVIEAFINEKGINYTVACSGRRVLPEPYSEIDLLPTTFYIDRNGTIQHVSVGYRPYNNIRGHATEPDLPRPREP